MAIHCMAWTREGSTRLLCVAAQDAHIHVIDSASGLPVRIIGGHTKTAFSLCVSEGRWGGREGASVGCVTVFPVLVCWGQSRKLQKGPGGVCVCVCVCAYSVDVQNVLSFTSRSLPRCNSLTPVNIFLFFS